MFNVVAGLLWLPLFTLAVLYYRYLYKNRHWNLFGTGKNMLVIFLYSAFGGFLVTILMFSCTLPFFWHEVTQLDAVVNKQTTSVEVTIQHIIGNGLQTQLFISGWIFTYISITTRQRIKETEITNLRLQNSLKEAQLANLTNQLNPHFLFNALNNIRFTIFESPQHAEAMLTELAELLRYSLESSQKEKVSLEQELTMVNHYLKVMKIQMEDRLSYKEELNPGCENLLVPPMILQLLVENAIKHGLDQRRHGGTLGLKIAIQENHLLIQVRNDLADSAGKQPRSTGLGLTNIESRLKLLYASDATIKTETTNEEFIVKLQLPLEQSL